MEYSPNDEYLALKGYLDLKKKCKSAKYVE